LGAYTSPGRGKQDHRTVRDLEPLALHELLRHLRAGHPETGRRELCARFLGQLLRHRQCLTHGQYRTYFRFSIVRNPWSRVVSWYGNLMRDGMIRQICGVPEGCPFGEFVRCHLRQWATYSQFHWLRDREGNLPFDRIVRFREMGRAAVELGERLGIRTPLPHLGAGNGRPYTEFHDQSTRDLVGNAYAEEIAHFDFRYGE